MTKLTITEALAEIKTIGKRLEKKKQAVLLNVARDGRMVDPMVRDGGSEKFVASERQAIRDLEDRLVRIRTLIQLTNLNTPLQIGKRRMSVAEWLTFRREIAEGQQTFYASLSNSIRAVRAKYEQPSYQVSGRQTAVAVNSGDAKPVEVAVHLNEHALIGEQEELETLLGTLDGQLSLLNATTTVEV